MWFRAQDTAVKIVFAFLIASTVGIIAEMDASMMIEIPREYDSSYEEPQELFHCNDSQNSIIDKNWVCDSAVDCVNGIDEHISTCNKTRCHDDEFECGSSGICLGQQWVCDGRSDCIDSEDEVLNCDYYHEAENDIMPCNNDTWKCKSIDEQCIEQQNVCDGAFNCKDKSDEMKETCEELISCNHDSMPCYNPTSCVPKLWKCDGINDCLDGSDEINCDEIENTNHSCATEEVACNDIFKTAQCVPLSQQCDGVADCWNNEDEGAGCLIPCQQMEGGTENTCSQKCNKTPNGPICSCNEGYSLMEDNRTCTDIDECSSTLVGCEQLCVNTLGSYECQCTSGFGLASDKLRCKPYGHDPTYLFFGIRNEIRRITLLPFDEGRTNKTEQVIHYESLAGLNISSEATVTDVDYMYRMHAIFWLEKQNRYTTIKYRKGDGNVTSLVQSNSSLALQRISVDWIGMNVFFTAKDTTNNLDGAECTTCGRIGLASFQNTSQSAREIHGIAENLGNVMDVVVIAGKGIVVTCEYAILGRILAVATDGSDSRVLKRNVMRPNSLTHDDTTNTLFWSQAPPATWSNGDNDFQIRAMSLSSMKEKIILSRSHPYFITAGSISYFENRIRWYDIQRNEIISADVKDGKHPMVLAKFHDSNRTIDSTILIQISHPALQQNKRKDSQWYDVLNCEYSYVLAASDLDVLGDNSTLVPQCICPENQYFFSLTSSCKVQGSYQFVILDNGNLRKIYDVGPQSSIQLQDSSSAVAIVYDPNLNRIYYMDIGTNSIRYVAMNGSTSKSETFVRDVIPTRHFAIDPTTGTVYWIERCSIVAAMPAPGVQPPYMKATVFNHEISCPEGLAYDIHRSRLYFTIKGPDRHLYSTNAYGGDIKILLSLSEFKAVRHMAFDPYSDSVLYIVDPFAGKDYIINIRLMTRRISVYGVFTSNPSSLAVTSKKIVVYDPIKGLLVIQRKSKNGGGIDHVDIQLEAWPKGNQIQGRGGIAFVDSKIDDFRNTSNPCSPLALPKAPCSKFCFPSPDKPEQYKCGCPDGYSLNNDGYSCEVRECGKNEFSCNQYNSTKDVAGRSRDEFPDCIDQMYTCDGTVANCYDGSDESVELCGCDSTYFKECRMLGDTSSSTNVQCLRSELFCNNVVECVNGADELNCTCDPKTDFQCSPSDGVSSPICIPLDWVGDSVPDCENGEDEEAGPVACQNDEFRCEYPGNCISRLFVCDGVSDCLGGRDEINCTGKSVEPFYANSTQLPESPATVITTSSTSPVTCGLHHFKCADGSCLTDTTLVCNGVDDCPDSSDEGGNCSVPCDRPEVYLELCAGPCYQSPNGPTCQCPEGYYYHFQTARCDSDMVDPFNHFIPNCAVNEHNCEHRCYKVADANFCKCHEGYTLERGYKCKAQGSAPYYFIVTESDFRISSFRGRNYYEPVRLNFQNTETPKRIRPSHFALRGVERFYWVDNESHRLYESKTWDGNTTLLTYAIPSVFALCWDWGGEKLFWATAKNIEVVTETGKYSATIISSINKINGLVINPVQFTLIYSTVSSNQTGSLILCSMDGAQCQLFADDDTDIFRSLTIDYVQNTLFWVSHYSNRIEKTPLSAFKRVIVYDDARAKVISGLAVFESKVSWIESDISRDEIDGNGMIRVTAQTDKSRMATLHWRRENLAEVTSRLAFKRVPISTGLGVIQEWSQPPVQKNICGIFSCQFFCWGQSARFCSCPDKRLHSTATYPLKENALCKNLDVCPTPPLSDKGSKLNVQFANGQPGGAADVTCPGEKEVHSLICKASGRWSKLLRCQSDYRKCQLPDVHNSTITVVSNPNALTMQASQSIWEDSVVLISCQEEYMFKSGFENVTIQCGRDGQWLSDPPGCVEMILSVGKLKSKAQQEEWIVPVIVVIILLIVIAAAILIAIKRRACFQTRKNRCYSTNLLDSVSPLYAHDNSLTVSYANNCDENGYAVTIGMRGTDVMASQHN